ncbi:MAG: DUF58 domain-containing protein [Candidatus Eisenbacteria bacterium]|nr:DUF58 domain-containing protein [Candidatus Eisenbacteria bacterium]
MSVTPPNISESEHETALEILRSVRRIEIQSRRLVQELFSGSYHAVFKGRGIEFSEVREYVPGDDIRSIDWNVTARMDRPFVKQYHEERERSVVFLVDRSGSTHFGSRRRTLARAAAEITAVLALSAAVNQDKVGLLLFTDRTEKWVPPRKGRSHVLRIVREVLFHPAEGRGTMIAEALERASRTLRRRSIVFLISDFLGDAGYESSLSVAARKHEVIPLVLRERRIGEIPNVGLVPGTDLETGRVRWLDTGSRRVREELARRVRATEQRSKAIFARAGVEAVEIPIEEDLVGPLFAYFRRRARWRASGR